MTEVAAPDRARLVTRPFVLVSVATFAYFVAVGVLLPTLPRYVEDGLGASSFELGIIVMAYGLAAILCRPALAWMARRFGERTMMVTGSIAATAGFLLHPLAQSVALLVPLRLYMGVCEAMLFVGAATAVNEIAPASRRAEAASYFSVSVFGGLGVGPLIGDRLSSAGHFDAAFVIAAAATAVAAVVAWFVPARRTAVGPAPGGPRLPLFHPAGVLVGLVLMMAMIGYTGWNTFLPLRADEVGASAGLLFLAYSLFVLLLRLFGARVPERVGLARCAAAALVLIGTALVVMWGLPGVGGLWVGTLLLGVGISLLYPSLMAIAVNSVHGAAERASVVATFTMFFEVGGAIGGLALGAVASAAGYQAAFLTGGLLAFSGLGLLWRNVVVPRRRSAAVAAGT